MKEETQKLEHLKEDNPFLLPEGYMEGLTSRIMSHLPDQAYTTDAPEKVTMMDHIRPWLYLAAVFAGLGLFINLLVDGGKAEGNAAEDSLWVQTTIPPEAFSAIQEVWEKEDAEYLEYIETQYVSYILAEEIDNYE
ncbi:MAG: hypothetical protein LBS88_06910 [Tannerellaceae bacterium]|jgi:hypothetical protein|nr:hypothetical protein [Tannerellaceae bacterium]